MIKKTIFTPLFVLCIFAFSLSAEEYVKESFDDGSRSKGADPKGVNWWSQKASGAGVVQDAVLDPSSSSHHVFSLSASSSYNAVIGKLPFPITLTPGSTVILTFKFRFATGMGGLRIGLYNSNGTAIDDADEGAFLSKSADDYGIFASVKSSWYNITREGQPNNANIFFGKDRTQWLAQDGTYPNLGNTPHTASLTYTYDGSNVNLNLAIDGKDLVTSAFTNTSAYTTFDEIAFQNDSGTGELITNIDDITLNKSP